MLLEHRELRKSAVARISGFAEALAKQRWQDWSRMEKLKESKSAMSKKLHVSGHRFVWLQDFARWQCLDCGASKYSIVETWECMVPRSFVIVLPKPRKQCRGRALAQV